MSEEKIIMWKCSVCGKKEKMIEKWIGGIPKYINPGPICSECRDKVWDEKWSRMSKGQFCYNCDGTGKVSDKFHGRADCPFCHGTGGKKS